MFIPFKKDRGFFVVLSAYKMKFRTILNGILSHYKKGEEYD
jgi:hypothetical protein